MVALREIKAVLARAPAATVRAVVGLFHMSPGSDAIRREGLPASDNSLSKTPGKMISQYLTMRDGTRLALDLHLPVQLPPASVPAVFVQTRYGRRLQLRWPWSVLLRRTNRFLQRLTSNGYAVAVIDTRGTGASFGHRAVDFSTAEREDAIEALAWLVRQPWSNGRVAAFGESYSGTAAAFLLADPPPSLKAVATLNSPYDLYLDAMFPGGVFWSAFASAWGRSAAAADRNQGNPIQRLVVKGVSSVDGDEAGELCRAAVAEHARNYDVTAELGKVTFRDDAFGPSTLEGSSPCAYGERIASSGVPVLVLSGWFDLFGANAAIKLFRASSHPSSRLVIGPWPHAFVQIIPGQPQRASQFAWDIELLRFFDRHLKDSGGVTDTDPPVRYWTVAENTWKGAKTWPPPRTEVGYYFARNGSLATDPPACSCASDLYEVRTAGARRKQSRWDRNGKAYNDTRRLPRGLLVYESGRLGSDIEVTGHPLLRLFVASTASDGYFFAYLEDVDPRDQVRYVTEGLFRAIHRQTCIPSPDGTVYTPTHSYRRRNALPMLPHEVCEISFELLAVSYQFAAGHRIRLALAGADPTHFAPLPGSMPLWRVFRSRSCPSHLLLPIVSSSPAYVITRPVAQA
jgi:putative CocE/NonD family hydrolase